MPNLNTVRNSKKKKKYEIIFSNKQLETWAKYIKQVFSDIEHKETQDCVKKGTPYDHP